MDTPETPAVVPIAESTVPPEYGFSGEGQEAHFQAAMDAALKEVAAKETAPAKSDVAVKIQEAADLESAKAKDADNAEKESEQKPEPEKDAEKDQPEVKASPGTVGKFRRLWEDGEIDAALKTVGVDITKFEPTTKQWKAIKRQTLEAREEADAVRQEAAQEAGKAQYVLQQLQPFINGAQAYLAGDFATFLKLTTGDAPEEFQRKLISQIHEAPKTDPAVTARLERIEKEREQERRLAAEHQQKLQEENNRLRYQQAEANAKGEIVSELKTDPNYAKVAGKQWFVDKIYDLQVQHYNQKTKTTIDTVDAAEIVWNEFYEGVVTPAEGKVGSTPTPRDTGGQPERSGSSNVGKEVTTTLRHAQTSEASPALSGEWSPESQEKIMEQWVRKTKAEVLQKELS